MIRVLFYLVGVLVLGVGLAWLADHPGDVVMTWQGQQIRTSLMAMALGLIFVTGLLILLWTIYRWIIDGPQAVGSWFRHRRQMRGYEALSRGIIAVGAGDPALAASQARQARNLLEGEPLVNLLTAQSAQLNNDPERARSAFREMLDNKETALLGLHGLYVEAERQGDMEFAARHADEAVKRAPGLEWAADAALRARVAEEDWDAAIERLQRNYEHGVVDKATMRRKKAVLLTAKAQTLEEHEPANAEVAASEAVKLAPGLVPAAVIAGRINASEGKMGAATSVLEKAWKANPHPDIAEVYAHVRSGDSVRDRLKRVKSLASKAQGNEEARIAVANAAIEALDWNAAREALEPLISQRPSRRVCLLMAEIEEGEHGDKGKVREWFARALRAPRDPAWVADGHVSDSWAPVSPITGDLDAYEWRVPDEDVAPPSASVLEARPFAPDGEEAPLLIDVTGEAREVSSPAPKPAPVAAAKPANDSTPPKGDDAPKADEAPKAGKPDTPPVIVAEASTNDAAPKSEVALAGDAAPSTEKPETKKKSAAAASKPPAKASDAEAPKPEPAKATTASAEPDPEPVFARAPDDPGPQDDDEDSERKWFGMFNSR
ncbi:heme biosynthesis HemY N-terminal domain-containing protein [Tepidamorphus sp. 3E244]|uniref:heme biosynthesis HemY N-terminal domain-containing protein n=1 Tax=Tepidamorphus sp. 3E244 TaxID=3385498 RepID=UPI0038FBFE51